MAGFIESIRRRDPAQPTYMEVVLGYPGYHILTLFHPVAGFLWKMELRALARFWSNVGRIVTGIEIHPQAQIGGNLFIDHGMGVVIGQTAVIGDYCTIYQGVTLGGRGSAVPGQKRHPSVGDDVIIGANAQVLGNITVGRGARIGAGAVVTSSVEENTTMIGNPAYPMNKGPASTKGYGLPDGDLKDPVGERLSGVQAELESIRQSIK